MLGERIRKLRKERGYSQQQLAIKLNLSQGAVSQWENGQTTPQSEQLSALADIFGITTDELLGRPTVIGTTLFIPDSNTDKERYAEIGKRVLDLAKSQQAGVPKTYEARIVSGGMDKLPQEQREQILAVVRAMFAKHPEIFEEEDE